MNQDKILTNEEKAIFYSSHIYSAVRLYCSVGNGVTLEQIKEKFEISDDRTRDILDFLLRCGLVVQKSGLFVMGTQHTYVEKGSPHLSRHHLNWRMLSMKRIENLQDEELQFTSPVSISKKDFEKVREILLKGIKDSLVVAKESNAEDIACLCIDLFWLND